MWHGVSFSKWPIAGAVAALVVLAGLTQAGLISQSLGDETAMDAGSSIKKATPTMPAAGLNKPPVARAATLVRFPGISNASAEPAVALDSVREIVGVAPHEEWIYRENVQVYVRGSDNALWRRGLDAKSGIWSNWESLGGGLTSAPSLMAGFVFSRGADNQLKQSSLVDFPNGTSVSSQGIPGGAQPVITSGAATQNGWIGTGGYYWVLARGADNAVWFNTHYDLARATTYQWHGWQSLGGQATSVPAMALKAGAENYYPEAYVFVKWTDNAVWYKANRGVGNNHNQGTEGRSWGDWRSLAMPRRLTAASAPAAQTVGSDLYLFVRGSDNALWYNRLTGQAFNATTTLTGAWSGWESLGGQLASGPQVIQNFDHSISVYVTGADNRIAWITKDTSSAAKLWSTWQQIP